MEMNILNKKGFAFIVVVLVILALVFWISFSLSDNNLDDGEIKIGASLSLSGYAAEYGENSLKGMILAAKEINEAGGVNGRELNIIFEDDGTNSQVASLAARKLIDIDNVDVFIGGTWAQTLEPIVPIVENEGLLIINPSTGNPSSNTRLSPNLFRTAPSIQNQINEYLEIIEDEEIESVVIFTNGGSWASAHGEHLDSLLRNNGKAPLKEFIGTNIDNNDFRTQISITKELNPDAVFLAVGYNDAANIIKRMKEIDFEAVILSSETSLSDALDQNLIRFEDVEGAYTIRKRSQDPGFIEAYEKEYGEFPGITADTAYLAIKVLAESIDKTDSLETETLIKYLSNSGYFDRNGDSTLNVPIFKVENGAYVLFN